MSSDFFMKIWNEDTSLLQEYLEIGIDSIADDETLKQIPIVNTIVGVFKLGRTISDRFFVKKLLYFLYNMQDIDDDEKEIFRNKYMKDDKGFAEKLILTIDRLDDTDKSKYLASIFKFYGRRKINYNQFRRYCRAINTLNGDEILFLKEHINDSDLPTVYGISLFNAGLGTIINTYGGNDYRISKEGKLFFKCVFEEE